LPIASSAQTTSSSPPEANQSSRPSWDWPASQCGPTERRRTVELGEPGAGAVDQPRWSGTSPYRLVGKRSMASISGWSYKLRSQSPRCIPGAQDEAPKGE
jgi:hypothetical protein